MELIDIQHVAIRTDDLEATNSFYTDVLGMRLAPRPDFNFPGSWLQMGETMIHVMAGTGALDDNGRFSPGSNAVDHLAFGARGFDAYKQEFQERGLDWRENGIAGFGLWQLFVKDPSGIVIELNFNVGDEPEGSNGPASAGGDAIRL